MPMIDVRFGNEKVSTHALNKEVYVIGRHEDCDIHIDNLGISRTHARLLKEGEGFCIEDMNSSNGTFLNGEKVQKQALRDGDQVVIGKYVLTYRASAGGSAAPAPAAEAASDRGAPPPMPGDVLHTMAMDGDAIRKRIEEMQQKRDTKPMAPAEVAPRAEPKPAERAPDVQQLQSTVRLFKIFFVLLLVALAAAVIYFLVLR